MKGSFVEKLKRGEEDAWREFVADASPRLFQLAGRFFSSRDDVEDVVQETFLRCYRYRGSIKDGLSLKMWANRVAIRVCYDVLRKKRDRLRISLDSFTPDEMGFLRECILDGDASMVERVSFAREVFCRLLEVLSPKDRMILVLLEVEGMTAREVGDMLGMSSVSVKMRRFRAKRLLSKVLRRLVGDGERQD